MSRLNLACMTMSIVLGCGAPHLPATDATGPELRITLHVFNYAGVPEATLTEAKGFATEVFRRAGITTEWADCRLSINEAPRSSACSRPMAATAFALRIVPDAMIPAWAHRDHLGSSVNPKDGRFGRLATVYAERAGRLAHRLNHSEALVLGFVMAHEIGHLLLGSGKHTQTGAMSFPVTGKLLAGASVGRLHFHPRQAKRIRIRLQVLRRTRAVASSGE